MIVVYDFIEFVKMIYFNILKINFSHNYKAKEIENEFFVYH